MRLLDRRWFNLLVLLAAQQACSANSGNPEATAAPAVETPSSPTATLPRSTLGVVVPSAEHVQTRHYRCQGRALERREPLETMMARIARIAERAESARTRPIFIGLRSCGSYRSLTLGDSLAREKRIYDQHGSLVATLETSDVVDTTCGRTPEEATVHHGQHVDCVETELLYPPP